MLIKKIAECPRGLVDAPLPVIWEVTRVALHCGVDLAHVNLRYDESWNDQDTLWDTLGRHLAFKKKRLPGKSDPLAWRDALLNNYESDGGAAVLLTATMHATEPSTVPLLKWELHPLKREQSSRLFRRFGSDRFLEVRVPSIDSWLKDEKDAEAIVASWLANQLHPFICRRWSAFFVRDRSEKAEIPNAQDDPNPRYIFNERVLFFAETGKGLSSTAIPDLIPPKSESQTIRTACTRKCMLNWLLNFEMNHGQSYLKLFSRLALGELISLYFPLIYTTELR